MPDRPDRTSDRYLRWTRSPAGAFLAKRVGLPVPTTLRRQRPGDPDLRGPVLLGFAGGDDGTPTGRFVKTLPELLTSLGSEAGGEARPVDEHPEPAALVFDATGITDPSGLADLYAFVHPRIRSLARCGRLIVLGTPPELADGPAESAAQRALEGFVRSAGKELRRGSTAHLLLVEPGAEEGVESALRFALSARSAYVSGQVLRIGAAARSSAAPADRSRPLDGRTALVTGGSRGIGEAVAETLARDGARVVVLDVPAQEAAAKAVAERIGGSASALALDITAADASRRLAEHFGPGGLDVLVHNAGIIRDRTLARMSRAEWDAVIGVNLSAPQRITGALLADGTLADAARVVCTASISGIAGNVGQANYAASKAGLIGLVGALGRDRRTLERGITVNAVAPGFIETSMTASIPLFVREAGRRMTSLNQGGLPVDVAEAVAFLAAPGSGAITGQVLRVCGQALLGA
ncbi:3-oxoacyl-ACP reductase [Phaeacidiphilus oryzae]|uniref:3-oxoacyl-ACP reductase n=1 Tax=Phaeacidiphilus oryzae TaxID=348818 RepID=UPI00056451F2|nr:3-oxoacyl-ACP reductase [Phaeacidiphilus oryzae]